MRRASLGVQPHTKQATRCSAEAVVGRLAVDQVANAIRRLLVGDARAVAAALLADDEEQPDACLASTAQPIGRRDLGRENALRVARAAAEQQPALLAARKERRHAVEVRGEDDLRLRLEPRVDVEAAVSRPAAP